MDTKKNCRDFLLEINVEELPVSYVRPALAQLENMFLREFKALGISHGEIYSAGTKNLLIVYIKCVASQQERLSKEVVGPSKQIAFDEKGNFSVQAIGFAKTQGVKVNDLKVKKTLKGEYVFAEKITETRLTRDILRDIIPGIIKDVHFPKTMRWDSSGLHFARPIESVLVLFGRDRIPVKIGNVPQKKIGVFLPEKYLESVRGKCLIDPDKRKAGIRKIVLDAVKKAAGDPLIDEALLEEINFLVTNPGVFVGSFDKKFLALPEDVLKASMSKYQRLFSVSKHGRIVNKFIAVIDGSAGDIKCIRANYENVLKARLQDSWFFFEEDTKKSFSEHIFKLKDLIFQRDLGTMFEKNQRLQELCVFICKKIRVETSLQNDIQRAAQLSKADLTTHMVGEFPSLQGIMGGEYALRSGERPDVALAIGEHYLPQGADGDLPQTLGGAILAVSDRIDNIVGFLGIGAEINSSFDPFGIRRNTQALIQIIKGRSLRFKIDELIQKAIELYGSRLKISPSELGAKIMGYIKERVEFLSGEVKPEELKRAVLEIECSDIVDIFQRISDLSSISTQKYFLKAAKVVERTSNILKGSLRAGEEICPVNEHLFKEDLERRVWKTYLDIKGPIQGLIDKAKYKDATELYAGAFYKELHDFFGKVLVNTEDDSLRLNRLALMKAVNKLYTERIADLAKLPQIVV